MEIEAGCTVELIPAAPYQQPILANLFQLYAHDFSRFHPVDLDSEARFTYTDLPLYWTEADQHPILLRIHNQWAGFALIKKVPNVSEGAIVWDMAEFFLLRRYRGQGIGTHAAHSVWQLFPGQWQVRVMEANAPALRFWAHALECFFGRAVPASRFERDSAAWSLFSFSVPKS